MENTTINNEDKLYNILMNQFRLIDHTQCDEYDLMTDRYKGWPPYTYFIQKVSVEKQNKYGIKPYRIVELSYNPLIPADIKFADEDDIHKWIKTLMNIIRVGIYSFSCEMVNAFTWEY